MGAPRATPAADPAAVLTKATQRAAALLGMSQRELAAVLGTSEASISRLGRQRQLDPDGKEGELALLFLRLFRSLDALVGGNVEQAREWFLAHNHHLDGVPSELAQTVEGLVRTVMYLDALRAPN